MLQIGERRGGVIAEPLRYVAHTALSNAGCVMIAERWEPSL